MKVEERKPVVIFPSGVLSANELSELKENGYIVIITDEPEKIKFLKDEKEQLMGIDKDVLIEHLMYVVYNADNNTSAMSLRDWLMRILFNKMGVKKSS